MPYRIPFRNRHVDHLAWRSQKDLTARKKYSILFSAVVIIRLSSYMFLHARSFLWQYFCCAHMVYTELVQTGGNACSWDDTGP